MDFTPVAKIFFSREWAELEKAVSDERLTQEKTLRWLLHSARHTLFGRKHSFDEILRSGDIASEFAQRVPIVEFEDIRKDVLKVVAGEKDVLWPGRCRNFAQSSGTSGGKSKYIPVTDESLRSNHYRAASLSVASYLHHCPESRIFSGKGLILGGSFANELRDIPRHVRVGDLSATLISKINPIANIFRVPSKSIALLSRWEEKLPVLAEAAAKADITNLSGVPSWLMTVLRRVLEITGKSNLLEVWPNLEVFFHGGISFEPYRGEYAKLIPDPGMYYLENYNASEGFFAVQTDPSDRSLLLLPHCGIFYEFLPVGGAAKQAVPAWEVEPGKVYELMISSCNGLWRYRLGDTVRIESLSPLKIKIAGRTKTFINAFGEELMESNAEQAIAAACSRCSCAVANYTAAPVYAHDGVRGRHQWLVEWIREPQSIDEFARILDEELRKVNSDYDAKRTGDIFLSLPQITSASRGVFDRWLAISGSGKLGGQRKVPRLSNGREIIDLILNL